MFIYFNSVIKRLTFCLLVGLCILKGMIYVVALSLQLQAILVKI